MAQWCFRRHDVMQNGVEYPSGSSDKIYKVTAFVPGEVDHCECIAFVMARNKEAKRLGLKEKGISAAGLASTCKHLKDVYRLTCQWKQETEDDYEWNGKCPNCGGPTVEYGKPMIPEGADRNQMDDLVALRNELLGTEDSGVQTVEPGPEPVVEVPEIETVPLKDDVSFLLDLAIEIEGDVDTETIDRLRAIAESLADLDLNGEYDHSRAKEDRRNGLDVETPAGAAAALLAEVS